MTRKRARYVRSILRLGPEETAYAWLRARRRRRNEADHELALLASDRLVLSPDFAVSSDDLAANGEVLEAYARSSHTEIRTIQWFVPAFHLVWGGGVLTLLRFADYLTRRHGVENRFCVFDSHDPAAVGRVDDRIAEAFPALAGSRVAGASTALDPSDAAVATAWESVWPLVRLRNAKAKFVFVQDWEPDFYPAGSASAMLSQAARLGIPGIVNTEALADVWRAHGSPAVAFRPAVDTQRFRSAGSSLPATPTRVFFYGRPKTARNAFGLGLAALRQVKESLGDSVEIICAGEDWSPGMYGAADVLENVGMLESLDHVAELYRSCHIGLVFMLSRHPSYQPLEFMASGMATVSNENPYTDWLLRHEQTALTAPPIPALIAAQIERLVTDPVLRERLVQAGLEEAGAADWESEFERVWLTVAGELEFP